MRHLSPVRPFARRTLVLGLGLWAGLASVAMGCSDSGGGGVDLNLNLDGGDAAVLPDRVVVPDEVTSDLPVGNDPVVTPDVTADTTVPPDAPGPDGTGTGTQVPPDLTQEGLLAFANAGEYLQWLAEADVHPSAGPHGGGVRIFYNDAIAASLAAGNQVHPRGSVLVKELWGDQREAIQGFAIDVKVEDGEGPDTWLFMEYFPPKGYNFYGVGVAICTGCHGMSTDYVWAELP